MGWLEDMNPFSLFDPNRWKQGQQEQARADVARNIGGSVAQGAATARAIAPVAQAVNRGFMSAQPAAQPAAQPEAQWAAKQPNPLDTMRADQAKYQADMRGMQSQAETDRLAAQKMQFKRLDNPFTDSNAGYQGMMSQIAGNVGGQLANLQQGTAADAARNGIRFDSGAMAQMQNANNMQAATAQGSQINGATMQNFQSRNQHDLGQQSLEQQFDQAKQSNNLQAMQQIQGMNQAGYNMASQSPFDAQRYEQNATMNPLDVRYRQGQLTGQGYDNQHTGATLPGRIGYDNARYGQGTAEANGATADYNHMRSMPGYMAAYYGTASDNANTGWQAAQQARGMQWAKPATDMISGSVNMFGGLAKGASSFIRPGG